MKRVMAIDYGDARTGVVVSDESATIAGDAWVIYEKRMQTLAQMIISEAEARGVGVIVLGCPLNMNGTAGPRAEKTEQLAAKLRKLSSINVTLWDERMTTLQAGRILTETGAYGKKRKQTIDAVAAALILESYLARSGVTAQS